MPTRAWGRGRLGGQRRDRDRRRHFHAGGELPRQPLLLAHLRRMRRWDGGGGGSGARLGVRGGDGRVGEPWVRGT